MKNLLNPKWLIIINTIPVAVLFLIFYSEFSIIKTLLNADSIQLWYNFGITLFALTVIQLIYTILLIVWKKKVSIFYAFIALTVYTVFLYIYSTYSSDIITRDIPRWMISGDLILYVGTFLMPTLAHALFIIVIKLTVKEKNPKAWKSFLFSLSVPLLCYVFIQITLPLWRNINSHFSEHVLIIGAIISVLLFLFFLIRSIYILSIKKGKQWTHLYLASKILIGIILPLIGLAVNNNFNHIFGDFNSKWFYSIAVINGILICLTGFKNKKHRFLLFLGRCITFSYTFYFFLVFLPFLPLSVVAIIALGTGFLMLTPLVLFIIHTQELSKDYAFLKDHYSKNALIIIALIGFIVIPFGLTISYMNDKQVLHETLDYIYAPDYSKEYHINKTSLKKTIDVVRENKKDNREFIFNAQTPYLGRYFNWLVLDNLTLSDTKIKTIEKIFFKTKSFQLSPERLVNKDVEISNINTTSKYNEDENSWTSWIDLEITNANKDNFISEYATTINLPNGCWVSDYYLYVGDRKEMGILAEKKSAMWIFSQIRNMNRDPGLLHYLSGNRISFRVFPFAKDEIRKTGIQFIHKDPVTITIDKHKMVLGEEKTATKVPISDKHVVYISSKEKETLQKIKRTPYFHFIIDISKGKNTLKDNYIKTIDSFIKTNKLDTKNAKISFSNTYTSTINFDDERKNNLNTQNFDGGFYLERAIKKTFFSTYTKLSNNYPILIVVTDNMLDAVISKNFADFEIAYPESNLFYHLNTLGYLASHNLSSSPKNFINSNVQIVLGNDVLAWPNKVNPLAYLPNNSLPSIVLKSSLYNLNESEIESSNWNMGLKMQGKWISDVLHPENAEKNWITSVKMSFKSKIMTPHTSYIVVENEAQKATLKKKQEQVLSGKKSLDLNERTQRMSEPEFITLLLLFGGFLFIKRKQII